MESLAPALFHDRYSPQALIRGRSRALNAPMSGGRGAPGAAGRASLSAPRVLPAADFVQESGFAPERPAGLTYIAGCYLAAGLAVIVPKFSFLA